MAVAIPPGTTTAYSESPANDEVETGFSDMKSGALRTIVLMIGGLAVLVGGVWIGQGAGWIKGSFMTGSSTWLGIGLLCLIGGLFSIFFAVRRRSE
jgi:hypothetical protein